MKIGMVKTLLLIFGLFVIPTSTFAFTVPGNPAGYVNDYAAVFSPEERNLLETKLREFNTSTSNEVAVVVVSSLDGDYIEHYANQLFQAWKIGTDKHDNGVLLLVAIQDRKMRIEVGYGLEGVLTDAVSNSIIVNDLTPAFKLSNYYSGVDKAIDDIIAVTKGEYTGGGDALVTSPVSFMSNFSFQGAVIAFLVAVQFLAAILGRTKSWWLGGVIGGATGVFVTYFGFLGIPLVGGGIVTVVLVLLGLLFDFIVSTSYLQAVQRGSSIPWWVGGTTFGGGGSSRGGGGGSSFGGFGGGSSGGGGASGSW